MRSSENSLGYACWCAVASYFDGDGTVGLELSKLTIRFRISWSDSCRSQVEQVKRFLDSHDIVAERIIWSKGAYHLEVGRIESTHLAALKMLRSGCAYKKRRELAALVAYYDDKLTGNQVVREFNECVRLGIRSGYERTSRLPLTYKEALRLQARLAGKGATRVLQKVDATLKSRIVEERTRLKLSVAELARIHHLGKTTISRVLRGPSGAKHLDRLGEQETLD